MLALQGLRQGRIQPEHFNQVPNVLINGASGGVGSFSVTMAKSFGAKVTGVCSTQKMGLLLHKPNAEDLEIVKTLFESGKVIPVIDKCYPLSDVDKAIRYFGEGQTRGKIVISVQHDNDI